MIVVVGGKPFIPFKAAVSYLGGIISVAWLYENEGRDGFPQRVCLSERKTGYWQSELDRWVRSRSRHRQQRRKSA